MTVALDTGGADDVRRWIEGSEPTHPSLVDAAHELDAKLGVVNVPTGVWIDETGTIVRPPEHAEVQRSMFHDMEVPEDLDERLKAMLVETKKIPHDPELKYVAALRDWVGKGGESRYALAPDEVVARSRGRSPEHARAAAAFELGQHLWRQGERDAAIPWFREAHRLHPENWTYKRQCWEFVSPMMQGPSDEFEGDWLSDIQRMGAERYYDEPAFD